MPDKKARQEILDLYINKLPAVERNEGLGVKLAESTEGFSGAELAELINEAALLACRQDANCVEHQHFMQSLDFAKKARNIRTLSHNSWFDNS